MNSILILLLLSGSKIVDTCTLYYVIREMYKMKLHDCGFLWAEEWRSRKHFPHTRLGVWVKLCREFQVTWLEWDSVFVLPSIIAWRAQLTHKVSFECIKLKWNNCVIVRHIVRDCYVNKGQGAWFNMAWIPAVCENC